MTVTRKFSQFSGPAPIQAGDIVVGLRNVGGNPVNFQFTGVGSGGGGAASNTFTFNQGPIAPPLGPLFLGAAVRVDVATTQWVLAQGNNSLDAEFYAFVVAIVGTTYTVQFVGVPPVGIPALTGLIAGTPYYLSDITPGALTAVPPAINGEVNYPVLWAIDGVNTVIRMSRGFIVGGSAGGGGGGSSGAPVVQTITQGGPPLSKGNWLYISADNTFALGDASNPAKSNVEWVVTNVVTPGSVYQIQQIGQISGVVTVDDTLVPPILSVVPYYLSPTRPGFLTATKPTTPGFTVKPLYIQQIQGNNTGWILDWPSELVPAGPPSPLVFMGALTPASPDGPYADSMILSRNGKYNSYLILINNGMSANAAVPSAIGFQLYVGGAWDTTANQTVYASGVNSSAGGTLWGTVSSSLPLMAVFPAQGPGTRPALASGQAFLHSRNNIYDMEFNVFAGDGSGLGWTSMGQAINGSATPNLTGIRLAFTNGAVLSGMTGNITIWGIPNS